MKSVVYAACLCFRVVILKARAPCAPEGPMQSPQLPTGESWTMWGQPPSAVRRPRGIGPHAFCFRIVILKARLKDRLTCDSHRSYFPRYSIGVASCSINRATRCSQSLTGANRTPKAEGTYFRSSFLALRSMRALPRVMEESR